MLPCVLVLAAACADVIPLDPRVAFDDLEARYRRSAVAERVDIRVFSSGSTRSETILFQYSPPSTVQASFGSMRLWSDSKVLRVEHLRDLQACFETTVAGGDTLGAIEAVLPPFPAPQFALALSGDAMGALTPYARNVRWTDAEVDDSTKPALVTIRGESDRARVVLIGEASTGRIRSVSTVIDGGRARIEVTCAPLSPAETPAFGIDPGRRRVTGDLSELRPRLSRVLPGDAFGSIELRRWKPGAYVDLPEPVPGPAAVVFVRRWKPGQTPHTALRAGDEIAGERPGFKVLIALVLEPGTADERALIDGVQSESPEHTVLFSDVPADSIERLSEADQVLVVVDGSGVVRAVQDLPAPREQNAEVLAAVIRGALR